MDGSEAHWPVLRLLAVTISSAAFVLTSACGQSAETPAASSSADAGPLPGEPDAPEGAADVVPADGTSSGAGPDVGGNPSSPAPRVSCQLADGSDPVALCTTKALLRAELEKAYAPGRGVASAWDAFTGATAAPTWQDDLGLASSIATYLCNARVYGDGELDAAIEAVLPDLAMVLQRDLPAAPPGYDGEVYFRLRNAAAAYFTTNDDTNGRRLAQLAEDYARSIQATYAHVVPSEAGAVTLIGSPAAADAGATGAAVAYQPAQAAMASAALLDMARLHLQDPAAASNVARWQATAVATLEYLWNRSRDPTTGLFFSSLVASQDPSHDAVASQPPPPDGRRSDPATSLPSDALVTNIQASVVMALARAQERVDLLRGADAGAAFGPAGDQGTYLLRADAVVSSLVTAKLYDGASSGSQPGTFLAALVPSLGGAVWTDRPTAGNAALLGGSLRIEVEASSKNGLLIGPLLAALLQPAPAHSSLLTVLTDATGRIAQDGYVRASSRQYDVARALSADGGTGAEASGATTYDADALAWVIEGLAQRWFEHPNPPECGF
jgi:hypothetical protein